MTEARAKGVVALALIAACWPPPAAAQAGGEAPTAEQLLTAYRDELRRVIESDCSSPDENNVIVCGRRPRQTGGGFRVPDEPEPGARIRLIAGEPPSARAALAAGGCIRLCHQPVTIDLIGGDRSIVNAIRTGIGRLLHPD